MKIKTYSYTFFKSRCFSSLWVVLLIFTFYACKKSDSNNQSNINNPNNGVPVNIYLTTGTPQFLPLNIITGYTYVAGGNKGILVYRKSQSEFLAYERNCPHDGNSVQNAIVSVTNDQITLIDSICGSKFLITDGSIVNGPSAFPMYQYNTYFDGTSLRIYN